MEHIIIVIHTLAVGGAERRISTMAGYFVKFGARVTVVLLDEPVVKIKPEKGVEVVCVNQNPDTGEYNPQLCSIFHMPSVKKPTLKEKMRLSMLRKNNPDEAELMEQELFIKYKYAVPLNAYLRLFPSAVVVSFMTIPNISSMMALKDLPNRAVFGDATDVATEYPEDSPFSVMRKKYYSRADCAVFQTYVQRDYYSFLPETDKYVIPNFVQSRFLPERFTGTRRKEIVNFCRLNKAKNLPLLVDAFSEFAESFPEYSLAIYGEGQEKEPLEEYVQKLNLSDKIHIFPFDLNIHQTVRDAAMFVSSSDREGISNSMLESMAIGLPCVCTDCSGGGAAMMIEDHENGLLVPAGDAGALCEAMKEIASDPGLSEKLSLNAVKIRERLEPERICREMYDAILGKTKK